MLTNITKIVRYAHVYSRPLGNLKPHNYNRFHVARAFSSLNSPSESAATLAETLAPTPNINEPAQNVYEPSTVPQGDAATPFDQMKEDISEVYGSPQQTQVKIDEQQLNEHCYVDDMDVAQVTPALNPLNEANTTDIGEMLSYLTPGSIYEIIEKYSKEALLYSSHDLGLGMGWGIIAVSLLLRGIFVPLIAKTQLNAIKMKLLDPEMKNFQNLMQKYQRAGDFQGMKQARQSFSVLKEKYGLSNILPLISLIQVPFLITWFITLRYVANSPDKYPSIQTDGFLWFKDLSVSDPYFILPLISAIISYYNIQISTLNATSATGSPMARYSRYIKYAPFVAIPFAVFFPSALNLYWIVSSSIQLLVTSGVRSKAVRAYMNIPEYLPGSILEKMHAVKKPEVIRTVTADLERPAQATLKSTNVAEPVAARQSIREEPPVAKPTSEKVDKGPVSIYSNKPKKSKK